MFVVIFCGGKSDGYRVDVFGDLACDNSPVILFSTQERANKFVQEKSWRTATDWNATLAVRELYENEIEELQESQSLFTLEEMEQEYLDFEQNHNHLHDFNY